MKFNELVEGKKYTAKKPSGGKCATAYKKVNGLLWEIENNDYSLLSVAMVATMEFEEIPQYVTWEEARKHMENGGDAKLQGSETTYMIRCGGLYCQVGSSKKYCVTFFKVEYLDAEWILIGE